MSKAQFVYDGSENAKSAVINFLDLILPLTSGRIKVDAVDADTSTMPMKRLWRKWMAETAKWMAENGATMPLYYRPNGEPFGKRPFNPDDAHEAFMRTWGGVKDGDRERQERATKEVMLHIMVKHESWCLERGIPLTIPSDSEYVTNREAA